MAAAHCIKVMLFHHNQISFNLINTNDRTCHRITVMPIHTLELDLLTIHVNNTSVS